jgi:hypothetical protein
MYGSDDTSITSPPVGSQIQSREVNVDDNLSSKNTSNKMKTKPTDHSRSFSVRTDDIDTAFNSMNDYKNSINKSKESEVKSTSDTLFGLSTIKENLDTDENIRSLKHQNDEDIDFDNYFNQNKPKTTKKTAPIIQQSKERKHSALSQLDDIHTPSTSISVKLNPMSISSTITDRSDNKNDSTDEDVDELLGKLEVSIFGKYTHTYIHTHTFCPLFFIYKKIFLLILLYVCVQCIFLIRNFSYQKKP